MSLTSVVNPASEPGDLSRPGTPAPAARLRRRLGLAGVVLLAGALSGCVVLPWGPGRHHGHGRGHYAEPDRGGGHGRHDPQRDQRPDDRRGR